MDERIREIAQEGARRLLQAALESEIESHINANARLLDEQGYRTVVRNGHAPPERPILSAVGPVQARRPRLDERKASELDGKHQRFTSGVLPRFLRRTASVEGVVAALYLKGISTNDFDVAVQAIYGEQAGSLSASTVSRLKEVWYAEHEQWRTRKLSASEYAYLWADGVYFNARIEGERSCILVIIESVFATVRLRTYKTKGLGTHTATLAMTFKLLQEAQKSWRRIVKWQQLELVQAGREFKDGILVEESAA